MDTPWTSAYAARPAMTRLLPWPARLWENSVMAYPRRSWSLVGPLFFCELVRFARRGRSILLRTSYALFLFLGLYFVYQQLFPFDTLLRWPFGQGPSLRPADVARFSATFAVAILALQSVAVVVLTPAYLAGAVAEERERRTLDLLLTTDLSNRDIIVGKLLGRLSHLGGILLAGLPILSLLQLWGGVRPSVLLAGFAATAATLFSAGSVSIMYSVLTSKSLSALMLSYVTVLFVFLACVGVPFLSPLGFVLFLEEQLGVGLLRGVLLGGGNWVPGAVTPSGATGPPVASVSAAAQAYTLLHGAIGLFCLAVAVGNFPGGTLPEPPPRPRPRWERRSRRRRGRRLRVRVVGGWGPEETLDPHRERHRPPGSGSAGHYPVTDAALLWKEVYHGADLTAGWGFRVVYVPVVVVGLVLVLNALLGVLLWFWGPGQLFPLVELGKFLHEEVQPILRFLATLLASVWCLAVAWRAAGSVAREREQRTLGDLLVLPTSRAAILGAKWVGGPLRFRWLGYLLAAVLTVALLSGAMHPAAVVLLTVAVAVHVAFLASLGVWLSLENRNTLWAYLSMAVMLLAMFAGSWIASIYSEMLSGGFAGASSGGWWDDFIQVGLSPLRTWWFLGFSWRSFETNVAGDIPLRETLGPVMTGVGAYALLAGVLWLAAWQRFRAEQPPSG